MKAVYLELDSFKQNLGFQHVPIRDVSMSNKPFNSKITWRSLVYLSQAWTLKRELLGTRNLRRLVGRSEGLWYCILEKKEL